MAYARQKVTRVSRTHRTPSSKTKNIPVKRTATKRNTNATTKRVATRIK